MQDTTSDSFVKEMLDGYNYSEAEWDPHRRERQLNMRIIAGDHWPDDERQARDKIGRLCVDFDEVNQHVNQVIGMQQMNEVGINVLPEGDGSNDDTAELEGDTIRSIEYQSKAALARIWALTSAAQGGYGFTRLSRQYEVGTFKQRIVLRAVQNPDLITLDGRSRDTDGADAMCGWVKNRIKRAEFVRQYGKDAKVTNFDSMGYAGPAGNWVGADDVQVAEYWLKKMKRAKLLQVQSPNQQTGQLVTEDRYEEELKASGVQIDGKNLYVPNGGGFQQVGIIKDSRMDELPEVTQYHTNGLEILGEPVKWDGQWIPIIPYYCKIHYLNNNGVDRRILQSLISLARGPQMAYSYCRTATLEAIGRASKSPYRAYEGQIENHPEWDTADKIPHPYLLAKATIEALPNVLLPLPARDSYVADISAYEVAAESYRRCIQAAIGATPLPTSAQRQNEKSGVALERIQDAAAIGTYGVIANYHTSIEMEGRQIEGLLESTINSERMMGIRKRDGSYEMKSVRPEDFKAKHVTTISVAPAFQSQREKVEAFGDNLAANNPEVFARIGWLLIKLRNMGPIGDQMSDLLKPADLKAADGDQDPAAMAQQMGQMQQAIQERDALLKELDAKLKDFESGLRAKEVEGQYKVQLQQMQDETEKFKTELVEANKRWLAQLNSKTTLTLPAINHKLKVDEIAEVHEDTMEEIHVEAQIQGEQLDHEADVQHETIDHQADVSHEALEHEAKLTPKLKPVKPAAKKAAKKKGK